MGSPVLRIVGAVVAAGALAAQTGSSRALVGAGAGSLDQEFGIDGKVLTPIEDSAFANAIAADASGRLVAVGSAARGESSGFAVARYARDGALDRSFGANGTMTTAFPGEDAFANALALQTDGKLVAAGFSAPNGATSGSLALARYDEHGELDRSFGDGGRVRTRDGSHALANAVAVQADGRIVVAGATTTPTGSRFLVTRYLPSGVLDPSFGPGGLVTTRIGVDAGASALTLEPAGKIVVAGWAQLGGLDRFAVARYGRDGSLDRRFGTNGIVTTVVGGDDNAEAIALQRDGKIVVAGGSLAGGFDRFALARYRADGSLDPTFGARGRVVTPVGSGNLAEPVSVTVEPNGKLIAVGSAEANWQVSFGLVRYDTRGRLDQSFGEGNGRVLTPFYGRAFPRAATLQSDGKLVVAGYEDFGGNYSFALDRYLVTGCVVPGLVGATLRGAVAAIARAGCALGLVSYAASARPRKGRVLRQSPAPGASVAERARIDLVLGTGRR